MTPEEIIKAIDTAITLGKKLYELYAQIAEGKPIPTWEELVLQNTRLQEKIDAEKKR